MNLSMIKQRFETAKIGRLLKEPTPQRLWTGIICLVIFLNLFYWSIEYLDLDLYYLIANGNYILEHGVPMINPFITTEGSSIVIQNWLYAVLVAWILQHLHVFGLWLLQVFFLSAMHLTILRFFEVKKSRNKLLYSLGSLAVMFIFSYRNLRPEMLTFLLVVWEIIGLEEFLKTGKKGWLLLLPVSTFLEINFHASYWIMHYIVLLPYVVPMPEQLNQKNTHMSIRQIKTLVPFLLISAGMLFVNPYGLENVLYVIKSLLSPTFNVFSVTELQTPEFYSLWGMIILSMLFLFVLAWQKKILDSVSVYMFLGFAILVISALKWMAFFAVGSMYLLRCGIRWLENRQYLNIAEMKIPVYCSILLVVVYATTVLRADCGWSAFSPVSDAYLDEGKVAGLSGLNEICDYLDEYDPDASVMASFEYENYFEYRGYKVFYDARPELYMPVIAGTNVAAEVKKYQEGFDKYNYEVKRKQNENVSYMDLYISSDEYGDIVDNLKVDYFVCKPTDALNLFYFEQNPEKYELVMKTDRWFFYGRR